jgi:hypothetical protein
MITFQSPITITLPELPFFKFKPIVLDKLDWSVTYDNQAKKATAKLHDVGRFLTLWEGADYDKAGQFNDSDVDARVNELLGPDYATNIAKLFKHP